jgi:hypothetical protein
MDKLTTSDSVSDVVIKNETLKPSTTPTDKEVMDSLVKQAKLAEDYFNKLVAQFQENLRKTYT